MFNMYIQGSQYSTGNPIQDPNNDDAIYNVAGIGTLYDNIRISNECINIIILGGAESYAYFAGYNYISYSSNISTIPNNFVGNGSSCYNCWTELNNAVISGIIPILNSNGNYNNKKSFQLNLDTMQ